MSETATRTQRVEYWITWLALQKPWTVVRWHIDPPKDEDLGLTPDHLADLAGAELTRRGIPPERFLPVLVAVGQREPTLTLAKAVRRALVAMRSRNPDDHPSPNPERSLTMYTPVMGPEIPVDDEQIVRYMHCLRCSDERPDDQSPREWARLNVGLTPIGFQVWCVRHECNVLHIDFEGRKPRASDWAKRR